MSQPYFALLTKIGEAKLANATALGTTLKLTEMGVGDGNGNTPVPSRSQTALVNEVRRKPLNQLFIDPKNANHIIAEQIIPENEGGWWIREIGLYDDAGDLCAVSNAPPTYKPILTEGSGRTQVIRMVLLINSDSTNTLALKIDPSIVLATREYVTTIAAQHVANTNPHPQYAPLASPHFTDSPTAPTPPSEDNSERLATTAFVTKALTQRAHFMHTLPMINLFGDSGRFYDYQLPTISTAQKRSIHLTAEFANPNFTLYATTVTNAGKFTHDNSTYRGNQAALPQNIIDLLTASKREQLRYGQEFYIAEFKSGAVTQYPQMHDGQMTYMALSCSATVTGLLTFSTWIRCLNGAVILDVTTHKNGKQLIKASPLVLPEEGWVHCSGIVNWEAGYSIIHFRCVPGSAFQLALPAFLLGNFVGQVHTAPLTSL